MVRLFCLLILSACGSSPATKTVDASVDSTCGYPGFECCSGSKDNESCGFGFGICVQENNKLMCQFCGFPFTYCCSFQEPSCYATLTCAANRCE